MFDVLLLILAICGVVLSYVAIVVVLTKAGYSGLWVLLPISLPVVFVVGWVVAVGSLLRGDLTTTLDDLGAAAVLVWLLCFANWVGFLVFAFADWPALRDARLRRPSVGGQGHAATVLVPAGPSATLAAATITPGVRSVVGVPFERPVPPAPTTFFCSWCGRERRSDAASIHHCGSRERPPLFCTSCGTTLEPTAEDCASCGTSASARSPG